MSRSHTRRPAYNTRRYRAPRLVTATGAFSQFELAANAVPLADNAGWDIAAAANSSPPYLLERSMNTGKWYWEQIFAAAHILSGIINDPTPYAYGGWSDGAASQVYSSAWPSHNFNVAEENLASPPVAPNGRLCFWYDGDNHIMRYGANGTVLRVEHDVAARSGGGNVWWPVFGIQGTPPLKVRLGPAGCLYAPPAGFNYY